MAELSLVSCCVIVASRSNHACRAQPRSRQPGPGWIHEIKHDGFRILARREAERVRLFTRHGTDFTARYPKIAAALESLPVRSCALDGEAIVVNQDGLSIFDLIRYRQNMPLCSVPST